MRGFERVQYAHTYRGMGRLKEHPYRGMGGMGDHHFADRGRYGGMGRTHEPRRWVAGMTKWVPKATVLLNEAKPRPIYLVEVCEVR